MLAGQLRKLFVLFAGSLLVLAGCAFLVLPGPGLLMLVAGLALLGTEFALARRWLLHLRRWVSERMRRRRLSR